MGNSSGKDDTCQLLDKTFFGYFVQVCTEFFSWRIAHLGAMLNQLVSTLVFHAMQCLSPDRFGPDRVLLASLEAVS
jgi:hypothetical protein